MPKSTKINTIKKRLLEALVKNLGNVTKACEAVECDRGTYYNYYNKDSKFKDQVDDIANIALDFVESKLYEKINGVQVSKGTNMDGEEIIYTVPPSDTAIIFYLKTRGKKRGYSEFDNFIEKDIVKQFAYNVLN